MRWRLARPLAVLWMGALLADGARAAPAGKWTLDPDGFGPLRIGMRVEQARAFAPGLVLDPPAMGPSPSCKQEPLPGHPGVWLMFVEGVLRRVDVNNPGIRTSRGIAPGDPVARVERAYPGATRIRYGFRNEEMALTAGPARGRAIRFEARGGKVELIYAGDWAQVQYGEGCD